MTNINIQNQYHQHTRDLGQSAYDNIYILKKNLKSNNKSYTISLERGAAQWGHLTASMIAVLLLLGFLEGSVAELAGISQFSTITM